MNEPAEYDVAHPIWLRGRDHGIAEERERIIALLNAMNGQGTIQTYVRLNGKDELSPSSVYIDRLRATALIEGEN